MKTLILLALVFGIPVAAMGANPTLTNFNARHFVVDPLALPTNVITLHLNSEQFDTGGSDITITNVFGPGTTNIFQTFITTNITAVTEYVTNLYVTYLVSSNSISGNIQGTPPHLSMFHPDNFSLADSIVTQNADTNGVTINGTGDGLVTLGGASPVTVANVAGALVATNANGRAFSVALVSGYTGAGTLALTDDGTYKAFAAAGDTLWTNLGGILQPKDLTLPVMVTNQIQFGQGGTNALERAASPNGSDLVYTNNTASPIGVGLDIMAGDGSGVRVSTRGTFATLEPAPMSTSTSVQLRDSSSRVVKWLGTRLLPGDTGYSLGGAGNAWGEADLDQNGLYLYGYFNGTSYSRLHFYHAGTNLYTLLSSEVNGADAGVSRPLAVDRNLGAIITTGDTTFVDMFAATQTNSLAGALTFAHATNGMDRVHLTHCRFLFNPSGADRTVTFPASWHNASGQVVTVTNNTLVIAYITSFGDTASTQTNVVSRCEFFP